MLHLVVFVCSMRRKLNFYERCYLTARNGFGLPPKSARAYARLCVDFWYFNEPESFPYMSAYRFFSFKPNPKYILSLYGKH